MTTVARSSLTELNREIDQLNPSQRVQYLFLESDDRIIYVFGLVGAIWHFVSNGISLAGLLITTAYADTGLFGLLGQGKNFIATLIFLAFILSLAGAIFASGAGRTASETFAKLLAGGLIGFVSGSKA